MRLEIAGGAIAGLAALAVTLWPTGDGVSADACFGSWCPSRSKARASFASEDLRPEDLAHSAAMTAGEEADEEPSWHRLIRGYLTGPSGPSPGCRLFWPGAPGREIARTLADGRFELPGGVGASAGRWLEADCGPLRGAARLTEDPNEEQELRVGEGRLVRVSVTDSAGRPVGGAQARLGPPGAVYCGNSSRQTDREGMVVLSSAEVGILQLEVWGEGLSDASRNVELLESTMDVAVTVERRALFSGRVLDTAGQPTSAEIALLDPSTRDQVELAWAEDDGTFEIEVPAPGSYRIEVRSKSQGWRVEELTLPAPPREFVLPLGFALGGRVLGGEGAPVVGASVHVEANGREWESYTGPDGAFAFEGLPAGTHAVTFEPRTRDVEPRSLEVTLPFDDEWLVRLERRRSYRGEVVDPAGRPLPFARLQAKVRASDAEPIALESDAEGRFEGWRPQGGAIEVRLLEVTGTPVRTARWTAVPPEQDEVRIVVDTPFLFSGRVLGPDGAPVTSFQLDGFPFESADGSFSFLPKHRAVLFAAAEGLSAKLDLRTPGLDLRALDLRLRPSQSFQGLVRDARTGRPVARVAVDLEWRGSTRLARSDARGSFELALQDGQTVLTLSHPLYVEKTVRLAAGAPSEILLEPATRVSIDASGLSRVEAVEVVARDDRRSYEAFELAPSQWAAYVPSGEVEVRAKLAVTSAHDAEEPATVVVRRAWVEGDRADVALGR